MIDVISRLLSIINQAGWEVTIFQTSKICLFIKTVILNQDVDLV